MCSETAKECKAKITNSYRQKIKRLVTKFSDNTIVALGPGTAGASSRALADVMAAEWAPAMQQHQIDSRGVQMYLDAGPVGNGANLDSLAAPISTNE
ncbi:hypothetical protein PybrP1_001298, partial [[Pythium] brassicae (nom. inval.)]